MVVAATQERLAMRIIEQLRALYGERTVDAALPAGRRLPELRLQSWTQDPFARGCYSVATPGSRALRRALAEPESGTLYFAGEAVGADVGGSFRAATISAAIGSGQAVAEQILA
jgi:monoamine oxidase